MAFNDSTFFDARQAPFLYNQGLASLGMPPPQPLLGQAPPYFDPSSIPATFGGLHVGAPTTYRMQTGYIPSYPPGQDQGIAEMRCIQRSILHKLEEMEKTLAAVPTIQEQMSETGKKVGGIVEKMGEIETKTEALGQVIGECKEKIISSGEKLESVRVGLHDFASDVNSWIHAGNGAEVDENQQRTESAVVESPDSEVGKMDLLQYIDETGMNFNFE